MRNILRFSGLLAVFRWPRNVLLFPGLRRILLRMRGILLRSRLLITLRRTRNILLAVCLLVRLRRALVCRILSRPVHSGQARSFGFRRTQCARLRRGYHCRPSSAGRSKLTPITTSGLLVLRLR